MIQKNYFFLLLFLFNGCAGIQQELDPKVYYVHDLSMKVDDSTNIGLGVVPRKDFYKIKLKSAGQMSLFVFETCHRERQFTDEGKRMTLTFTPIKGIEDKPECMVLKFSSFDKKKGKHAEGILLMKQDSMKLDSKVRCNGREAVFNGVSVCHSKYGLFQEIEFNEVVTRKETKCKLEGVPLTGKIFRFKMPKRECIFTFKSSNKERHLLFTSGYEQILLRNL